MLKLNTNSITLFGEIIFERRRLSRKQQRRYRNALYLIVSDHPHWTLIATRRLGHLPIILRLQLHLDLKRFKSWFSHICENVSSRLGKTSRKKCCVLSGIARIGGVAEGSDHARIFWRSCILGQEK